jgi:hypothetical protein
MLQRRLPARSWVQETLRWPPRWLCCFVLGPPSRAADRMDHGARGRGDADAIWVVFETAFDAVSGREKCVETLD